MAAIGGEVDGEAGAGDGGAPCAEARAQRAASAAGGQALACAFHPGGDCVWSAAHWPGPPARGGAHERDGEETAEAAPAPEALSRETVDAVLAAVEAGDHDALVALLEPLHEADIADLLEQISRPERKALIALWGVQLDGAVLAELEEGVRDEIVAELPDDILAAAVQDLETDDVVYLAEDMEAPQQERILRALDAVDRAAVEQSLKYDEYSAGRLMQREVVVAPEHWTVGDAIDFMRRGGVAAGELLRHRSSSARRCTRSAWWRSGG